MIRFPHAILAIVVFAASPAQSQDFWADIDLAHQSLQRGGNALNGGALALEIPSFDIVQRNLRFGAATQQGLEVVLSFRSGASNAPDIATGIFQSEDTFAFGRFAAVELDQTFGAMRLGGFAGRGHVAFTAGSPGKATDFAVAGLGAGWHSDQWRIDTHIGALTSRAVEPESLDNAIFAAISAGVDLTNIPVTLTVRASYARGDQDTANLVPNPVTLPSIGIEAAWDISGPSGLTAYVGADWLSVSEENPAAPTDRITETVLSAGLRWTFGSQSTARPSRAALPRFESWLAAVPAVD